MSKRQNIIVPQEEMIRQKQFVHLIKEKNQNNLKKYSISTFGCQMNEHDSEKLSGMLSEMGYTRTENQEESDLIIFNTCCVRENAEQKVYGHLGELKKYRERNPEMIVAVCGCMMQQPEVVEHIKKSYRHVNLVFGTHNLYKFPELIYSTLTSSKRVFDVWDSEGYIAEDVPIERKDGIKAWVTVMYGCNNYCSYCIVPYVRGRERSRDMEDIATEVTKLAEQGFKEITLLGQNVNSYGKDIIEGPSFAQLLKRLDQIEGIERIRFMTSHPKDLSDDLIYAIRDLKKVCKHLHLPVQAGSTKILEAMNRKYSKEQYLSLVQKIKENIPEIALSTDIIVGFPGETEEDFEETLDVIRKVRYDSAYTFLYSKRTGTPAAKNPDQVPEETKKKRFDRLLELQNTISREINDSLATSVQDVLVEGPSKSDITTLTGRTESNKIVNFKGNNSLIGKIVKIRIDKTQTFSLEGTVIK